MNKDILKSTRAVIGGFIITVIMSIGTDAVLKTAGILPYDHLFVSTELILFVLMYRTIYNFFGCYIAARLAPQNPMKHALVLGGLGMILGTVGAIVGGDLGPGWYAWTLVVTALPVAWLGGKWFEVRTSRSEIFETD